MLYVVITSTTNTLAITTANNEEIQQAITSASVVLTSTTKNITSTYNQLWFNIFHMAITSANNYVSTHNGITSTIK